MKRFPDTSNLWLVETSKLASKTDEMAGKADAQSRVLLLRCPLSLSFSASPAIKRSTNKQGLPCASKVTALHRRQRELLVVLPCCLTMHDWYWTGASSSTNEACCSARLAGATSRRQQGMYLARLCINTGLPHTLRSLRPLDKPQPDNPRVVSSHPVLDTHQASLT